MAHLEVRLKLTIPNFVASCAVDANISKVPVEYRLIYLMMRMPPIDIVKRPID